MIRNMPKKYFLLLLLVLPSVLYANALSNSFHYDDLHTIVNNPHIHSATLLDGFKKIPVFWVTSQYYSSETHLVNHYRPLLYTTYILNYSMGGLNPAGFRLVNLALHIGCVLLVYLLGLRLLTESVCAFLAALVFAIHPLFSEAINYISARSSLLATFFYLLAFYYFLKLRTRGVNDPLSTSVYFSLLTLSTLLAFLSKEIALTLPLVLLIYDSLFTRKKGMDRGLKIILPYIPMALIGLILLYKIDFIHYFKNTYLVDDFNRNYLGSILAQLKGLALIFWLFFAPVRFSIEQGIVRPESLFEPGVIEALSVLLGILGGAFFLSQSQKVIAFFLFWFVITSMPTTLVPLNIPLLEHRGYLPGVGLSMIMGLIFGKVVSGQWSVVSRKEKVHYRKHRLWAVMVLVLIFIIYAGITLQRNTIWKDPVSLWSDAVAKAPHSEQAWTNLGLAYLTHKDHQQALEALKQALLQNPDAPVARVAMGSVYHLQGRLDEAIQNYQEAISLDPGYFLPYFNLGVAYQQQGHFEKALNAYQESLKMNRHHPETHLNLGSIYFAMDQKELAIAEYQEALRLNPELADAHYNLAVAYEAWGQAELANRHYREAERFGRRSN